MVSPGAVQVFNRWANLSESEWVLAVDAALQDLPDPIPSSIDVRDWVFPDRMDVERLRDILDYLQVPETSHLGHAFTRRVGVNLWTYMHRNSWEALDRTARDLQIKYIFNWRHGDRDHASIPPTRRTAADIWVTPSPIVDLTPRYVQHMATWLRWVLPYLTGEVDCVDGDPDELIRPRIVVYLSAVTEPEVRIDHSTSFFQPRYVQTELVQ